jgi:hypothetical protein
MTMTAQDWVERHGIGVGCWVRWRDDLRQWLVEGIEEGSAWIVDKDGEEHFVPLSDLEVTGG